MCFRRLFYRNAVVAEIVGMHGQLGSVYNRKLDRMVGAGYVDILIRYTDDPDEPADMKTVFFCPDMPEHTYAVGQEIEVSRYLGEVKQ